MQSKGKNIQTNKSSQIKVVVSSGSAKINFNSSAIRKQLDVVKQEVKTILDGANVDSQKLNLNFTL